MQVLKDQVRNSIIEASRNEFNEKGFQQASLRKIAQRAGVSTSNIYNYFENKNILFRAVVSGTLTEIERALSSISNYESWRPEECSVEALYKSMSVAVRFINSNREDLELIFLKAEGSDLANYLPDIIDRHARAIVAGIDHLKPMMPNMKNSVSIYFQQILSSTEGHFFFHLLKKKLPLDEMMEYAKEYAVFMYHGYFGLLNYGSDS